MRNFRRRIDTVEQKMKVGRFQEAPKWHIYLSQKQWDDDGRPRGSLLLGRKTQPKLTESN